jgi:hypothetical protein
VGLGRDILNNSGIVGDNMVAMPLWRRVIIGHVVITHVDILQALWLSLSGNVFDRWGGHILPSLVWLTITSSIPGFMSCMKWVPRK